MDDKIIDLALDSDFKDFEDAVQHFIAVEHGCHVLITKNLKDFKSAVIPVLTAKQYLRMN